MPTATSADEAALCAAIRANPDCDTVRLVYADWLDENPDVTCPACRGVPESFASGTWWRCARCNGHGAVRDESRRVRAESIRVQVEIASVGPMDSERGKLVPLRARESALAARLAAEWPGVLPPCPVCDGDGGKVDIDGRAWMQCPHCSGACRVGSWVRGMLSVPVPTLGAVWEQCTEDDGAAFPGSSEQIQVYNGKWRLTPWARDELLARPWVCEVPILDREPDESVGHETGLFKGKITHDWNEETPQLNYAGSLPTFLFRALCDLFPDRVVLVRGARVFESDTPEAARTALARATAQAAFSVAGGAAAG